MQNFLYRGQKTARRIGRAAFVFLDCDHPCAEPWTEPSKYAPDPEFAAFDIPEPQPTVPMEVYRAYSVDRPYQEPPKMPVPYTTLAETFSYGI